MQQKCNSLASCRTKGRTGQWQEDQMEDVDDGSDGVAARPHGRMVNRTRDELTKAAQSKGAVDLGGIRKMESGCGLPFARRRASFDCSDPLTPRSQLASNRIWRFLPCEMRRGDSTYAWSQLAACTPRISIAGRPRCRCIGVLSIAVWLSARRYGILQPSWHADSPGRELSLAAGLKCRQDASPAAACM